MTVGSGFKGDVDRAPGFFKELSFMKKIIFVAGIISVNSLHAQSDSLDINNIHAGFNPSGEQFYSTTNYQRMLSAPACSFGFGAGNLWIGGYDQQGQLHVAAQTYRQNGTDFWAGPMDTTRVSCSFHENSVFNGVWKVNKTTIDDFLAGMYSQTPVSIAVWPGNGNPAFGESHYLAPFIDANGDGIYDPANGDYPNIRGDQAIFCVYNDSLDGHSHSESGGRRMGIEIRCMAYAVKCISDSALMNTIFVHYEIINRSATTYDSTIAGMWHDINVGQFFAGNGKGCDSLLNNFYFYDSTSALGIIFLNQNIGGSIYYNNDFTVMGNAEHDSDYYHYLSQKYKDDSHLTYGGNGYGGSNTTNLCFTGDPFSGSGWTSCSLPPTDKRTVCATYPFTFSPGQHFTLDYAYVFAHDYSNTPFLATHILHQRMQSIKNYYINDNTPCGNNITSTQQNEIMNNTLTTFPNPTISQITIRTQSAKLQPYCIFDTAGRLLLDGTTNGNETVIDVQQLPAGMYFVKVGDDVQSKTIKFVKCE